MGNSKWQKAWQLVSSGDMSADVTSDAINIEYVSDVSLSVQVSSGSSPTGDLKIQGKVGDGAWQDLFFFNPDTEAYVSSISITADGNDLIALDEVPFSQLRVFYDRTSGSGDLDIYVQVKGL